MFEFSIITGKIITSTVGPGANVGKRLYVKIYPGMFLWQAPRPKKAKVLRGELLVKFSSREWPEKKNGSLVGDKGILEGLTELLKQLDLKYASNISWSDEQRDIKNIFTIKVGSRLAQEMLNRGFAQLTEI